MNAIAHDEQAPRYSAYPMGDVHTARVAVTQARGVSLGLSPDSTFGHRRLDTWTMPPAEAREIAHALLAAADAAEGNDSAAPKGSP